MRDENIAFVYHSEFNKYMKVEEATSEDVFDYLFDVKVRKLFLEKGQRYLHDLFEKKDRENLILDGDFNNYLDNNGLEDIIREEYMQNLNMDD